MKKILVPLLMAAMISTTSLTASANPWRPENNEHSQPTQVDTPPDLPDEHARCESDDSAWELISKLEEIRSGAPDIQTLIEELEKTQVKTDTREYTVSDVQVLTSDATLISAADSINITDATESFVKVFFDEGDSWIEFPIKVSSEPDITTMSSNGNSYGFTLPLDRANLLTNYLTCKFGCVTGNMCDYCTAHGYTTRDLHRGLDMSWSDIGGEPIRAVTNATVSFVGTLPDTTGWRNFVLLQHDNNSTILTRYAHMRDTPLAYGKSRVNQGEILGYVGQTGKAFGEHLHFEVYKNGERVNPLPYLQGAQPYGSSGSGGSTSDLYLYAPGTYKICDGPLTLRALPNSTSTSYGTLPNGTVLTISQIQMGEGTLVYGKISAGTYAGKWIALGKIGVELYAANTSVTWRVFDGPLNIRQSASTSSSSYGTIANGSTFKITEVTKDGDFILAKIASSPSPTLASGSTCSVTNAKNHWLALEYCEPVT